MLSKNLENSTSYYIFFYKFWKKARVYYTLSISWGGGAPPLEIEKQKKKKKKKKRSSEQILIYFTYILLLFLSKISFSHLFSELGPPPEKLKSKKKKKKKKKAFQIFGPPPLTNSWTRA